MTDETKATEKNSPEGQASEGQEGTTPKKPETYTRYQVDKIVSDAKAGAGRQLAATARKEAENLRVEIAQLHREKDEAEVEAAQGDPEVLTLIQRKRKVREREAEVGQREAHLGERETKLVEIQRKQDAQDVATEYGVKATVLLEHTDGSREQMESLARLLPQNRPLEEPKPDSGITIGGGGTPTPEQMEDMSMDAYAAWYKRRKEREG